MFLLYQNNLDQTEGGKVFTIITTFGMKLWTVVSALSVLKLSVFMSLYNNGQCLPWALILDGTLSE